MSISIKTTTVTGIAFALGALTLLATILYATYPDPLATQHWDQAIESAFWFGLSVHLATGINSVESLFGTHHSLYENIRTFTGTIWALGALEILLRDTIASSPPDPRVNALVTFFYFGFGIVIHYYTHEIAKSMLKRKELIETPDQ